MSSVRNILEQFFRQFEASYETLNRIELSRTALLHNLAYLQELYGSKYVIPVLKANAYGHGLEQVVKILEDTEVPYVAVDSYHEALQVRAMSDLDVLVMGAILPENFTKIDIRHVSYVVQDSTVLNVLTNLQRSVKIHLEFNTGMNRQGFDASELSGVINILKDNPHIELDGVMTHFYDASSENRSSVDSQIKQFDDIVGKLKKAGIKPPYVHIAKTAGLSDIKSKHINTIRPGSGLYGVNPFPYDHPMSAIFDGLRPVLAFYSRLIKIRDLEAGDGVSYGHTYKLKSAGRVGILPVGYFEGVNEALANTGHFRHKNNQIKILGSVNMNHTMVDLTDSKAKLWDEIEIISRDKAAVNSLQSLWANHGLYPLVSLVRLGDDIRRVIVD